MALRIEETSVVAGEICNRTRDETRIRLQFADGFTMEAMLKGNAWRDIAGRTLTFTNAHPDSGEKHHAVLAAQDHGIAGDITASRKVKDLLVSVEEAMELGKADKDIPHVWKNSLYLEWFTLNGGRCVLEAVDFSMEISEPDWIMSDAEERETHQAAREALVNFMDQLVDLESTREQAQKLVDGKPELDEFEWEKFMQHSDKITDRYMELLDKYGDENHDKIDELMGWNEPSQDVEKLREEQEAWLEEMDDSDWEEPPAHPLQQMASDLLDQMPDRKDCLENPHGDLWFAIANISAKMAGATSGYRDDGTFDDNGFVIAQLKRVLALVNDATPLMQSISPEQLPSLMELRQEIIDLQQALRRRSR